ncbi:plasmid stabilization protein [Streptomyces sp. GC420]|uniref:plasmid stabilization protein n=1 Tax=Streptomyces sp. GC420 TaxID=2697568 RepID=UPI001414E0D2|nr:plasmid stabilization protein [Streptomyces sp. GC420]NBM19990.1 plasmid stabilization protein [Streptomyces sp. GC420]
MPRGSSPKRERQYEHIKESAESRGESEKRAKEIAARTVNKERARSGESKSASRTSTQDSKSAPQRGGERSGKGSQGPTYDQLYEEAKRRGVDGRSSMNKSQLQQALDKK